MANPSPTCQVREGAGAWQDTTDGVDVTAGSSLTIRLVDTSPYAWSLECIGTDETNSVTAVNAGLVVNNAAKTATLTAPAVGSALLFRSTVNGGVAADGTARPSYSATFKISVLTATGFRVGAFGETIENDSNYGTAPLVNELVRTVDGLVSGSAITFKAVGTITKGQAFCSANDPADATKQVVATLANLQAANFQVNGIALETKTDASFQAAGPLTVIDRTVHGIAVDANAVEASFVALNTTTGYGYAKRQLDGDDVLLGTIAAGSSSVKGPMSVAPDVPRGVDTISILDPRFGAVVLSTGEIVVDAAIQKILRKYAAAGCRIHLPRRKSDKYGTVYTLRDDEVICDLSDINASTFSDGITRLPLWQISFVGDVKTPFSTYGTYLSSKLSDFGYVRPTSNTGKAASIGAIDTTSMTFDLTVPQSDIWPTFQATTAYSYGQLAWPTAGHNGFMYRARSSGTTGAEPAWPTTVGATVVSGSVTFECFSERPQFPARKKEWNSHHIKLANGEAPLHRGRFVVLDVKSDGTDGGDVVFTCAIRDSQVRSLAAFALMTGVKATGTSPPTVTLSGTATVPVGLRVEINDISGGTARGSAKGRYSVDNGASWTNFTTAASVVLSGTGLTMVMGTGTYGTDQVYKAFNFCGRDPNNGAIHWRLRRFAFNELGSRITWENMGFYQQGGYYMSGWHLKTQSPRKNSSVVTHHENISCYYNSYPPGSFDTTDGVTRSMGGFTTEYGNAALSARDWFVDTVTANAWPMAMQPGQAYYLAPHGQSITPWAASTVKSVGQVVRPTGTGNAYDGGGKRNGYQYRVSAVVSDAKTGTSEPTWSTTYGATVVSGNVTFKVEYEGEDASSPAWLASEVVTKNTIRLPSVRNGLRYRALDNGTCGAEPVILNPITGEALFNPFDVITINGQRWSVEFDLGTETQGFLFAPYNCDYMHMFHIDPGNHRSVVWMDNPNGQAREYWWRNVNPVFGDFSMYSDKGRYTNEFGSYGQLDWQGGDTAVAMGVRVEGNAADFKFIDMHTESNGVFFNVAGPGAAVHMRGCRMAINANAYARDDVWARFDGEYLSISDCYHTSFANEFGMSVGNSSVGQLTIKVDQFRVTGGNVYGTPAMLTTSVSGVSGCVAYCAAVGQTLTFSFTSGNYSTITPATQALTCTLQSGDAQDWSDVRSHEWAKAINRDCGYNWKASATHAVNDVVVPGGTTATLKRDAYGNLLEYYVSSISGTGTSGATEPTWPTTVGATVTDNPGANQVVWTCRYVTKVALFAWGDSTNVLSVGVKGSKGSVNPYDEDDSPVGFIADFSGTGSLSVTGGTALWANGGDLAFSGGTSYKRQEIAKLSGGAFQPPNTNNKGGTRADTEVSLDQLCIIDVNGATTRSITGSWMIPASTGWSSTTKNSDITWADLDSRQLTMMTLSGTPVPLRNAGGTLTFTGPNAHSGAVFKRPEWTANYKIRFNDSADSYTGGAGATLDHIETTHVGKHGFACKRVPALSAGQTETRSYQLIYVPDEDFDPSKLTTATLKGWFRNKDLSVGLDLVGTGWVNSATGTNLLGALKVANALDAPAISLTAGGVAQLVFDPTVDGTTGNGDYLTSLITTPYAQPLHFFMTVKVLETDTAASRFIFSQSAALTNIFNFEYYGSVNGWYISTPSRINLGVANLEDQYHTITFSVEQVALTNKARMSLIVDNGTKVHAPTSSSGTGTLDGFTLSGKWSGTHFTQGPAMGIRGDIVVAQGQMSIEERRKVCRYLMNQVGDDV